MAIVAGVLGRPVLVPSKSVTSLGVGDLCVPGCGHIQNH